MDQANNPTEKCAADRRATAASIRSQTTVAQLAAWLKSPSNDPTDTARAVFRWIADNIAYDTESYFRGVYPDIDPQNTLERRMALCGGYSKLFTALASAVALETVTVGGFAPGASYRANMGKDFTENHAWNAVRLNGEWALLDVTWGAGYLDETGRFVRAFNDHYFLTPPRDFIYDHFPTDKQWQCLSPAVTPTKFRSFPKLYSGFFRHCLRLSSHRERLIQWTAPVSISIGTPETTTLLAHLYERETELDDAYVFVQRERGEYVIRASPPKAGEYILKIFAKSGRSSNTYEGVLEYDIQVPSGFQKRDGFPRTYRAFVENNVALYSPLTLDLAAGKSISFSLSAPGAENVHIVSSNDWLPLKRYGHHWERNAVLPVGNAQICARFDNAASNHTVLASYDVKE